MSIDSPDFIHRYLPATDPAVGTTLLLLHGTGGNEDDLLPLGRALLPGASLLSPRGKVLEHGAPRFFRRLAEGVFDLPDLIARTHELAHFVTAAAEMYGFDPKQVIAVGYSNGANIGASTLLLHPDVLAGAVLFRAMVPLVPQTPPDLAGVPVFIAGGQYDTMVPQAQTEKLASLLRDYGAAVTTRWHAGGHELSNADVAAARTWLASARAAIQEKAEPAGS